MTREVGRSRAEQWVAILDALQTRLAGDPAPVPVAAIAAEAGIPATLVARQLRLMARVGLVQAVGRFRRGWLLGNTGDGVAGEA